MGHLYLEALLKLREHILGIEITTSMLINPKCEDYCLSDLKRMLYRYPIARSTIPFKKLYWDLIAMKNGIGGETHTLYFINNYTRAHFIYYLLR